MIDPKQLPGIITAIGALGTAAFGLVDAFKKISNINDWGFPAIEETVRSLTPPSQANSLPQDKIVANLKANWANGTDLSSQKSIAKSLIKLNLSPANAAQLATATGVDSGVLTAVAKNIANGTALNSGESDVYGRFDLIVTALLDETYQRSDNVYTNSTRGLAAIFAVILAFFGGWAVNGIQWYHFWCHFSTIGKPLLVGLLATPLAPIAKDLSSALATAVNTMQAVKGKS